MYAGNKQLNFTYHAPLLFISKQKTKQTADQKTAARQEEKRRNSQKLLKIATYCQFSQK